MKLRGIWQSISELGIQDNSMLEDIKQIKATNQISILLFLIAFPYVFIFSHISPILGTPAIFIEIIFIVAIYLNKYQKHSLSKTTLILNANLGAFFYSYVLGVNAGVHLLFIAFAGLPMVLYSPENKKWVNFGIILPIFFQAIVQFFPNHFIKFEVSRDYLLLINRTAIFAVTAVTTLYIKFFSDAFVDYIQQLKAKNTLLDSSNTELKYKNEALVNEETAHQTTITELKKMNAENSILLESNAAHIERLHHSLSIQQKLFTDLQTESSEKTLALEKAKTEQRAKEEALLREQEKIALIYEQQQTIDNNQVELAEKASMDKMLKISETIQKKMLQSEFPLHDDYAFSVFFKPSHMISGDYFSVKELENGMIGFFVIDVTGHGTPAAILMTGVAIHLESLLSPLDPVLHTPSDVLSCLDDRLSKSLYVSKAVACSYSLYNPKTHELRSALGGAEPLRIWRHGKISTVCGGDGPVLNMFPDNTFCESRIVLEHDDVVLNFTDGLIELVLLNGDPLIPLTTLSNGALSYDYHNLETILAGIPVSFLDAAHIGNSLLAACQKPKDDITLLVLRAYPT